MANGLGFSDTTSAKQGLIQDCEFWTLGDGAISGNTILLQNFTRNINYWYNLVLTMILASMDDWDWDDSNNTDYPIGTMPLVAGQRDYTFAATTNLFKIQRVDVTYDGTNWYRAQPFDAQQVNTGMGNDVNTDAIFDKSQPFYDDKSNAIWIYPLAASSDVANGAKFRVQFLRAATEFVTSDTTKQPGFPTIFHRFLSIGASRDWAISKNLPEKIEALNAELQALEVRLKQWFGSRDVDIQPVFKPALTNMK